MLSQCWRAKCKRKGCCERDQNTRKQLTSGQWRPFKTRTTGNVVDPDIPHGHAHGRCPQIPLPPRQITHRHPARRPRCRPRGPSMSTRVSSGVAGCGRNDDNILQKEVQTATSRRDADWSEPVLDRPTRPSQARSEKLGRRLDASKLRRFPFLNS